jgi:ABC-type histidine transport system ATPase subunit
MPLPVLSGGPDGVFLEASNGELISIAIIGQGGGKQVEQWFVHVLKRRNCAEVQVNLQSFRFAI